MKTGFGVGDTTAEDLVIQDDGKLLVVGRQNDVLGTSGHLDFALARYQQDGTLDEGFGGGDGLLITDVSREEDDFARTVDIDGEGGAVVGGQATSRDSSGRRDAVFGLARYLLE